LAERIANGQAFMPDLLMRGVLRPTLDGTLDFSNVWAMNLHNTYMNALKDATLFVFASDPTTGIAWKPGGNKERTVAGVFVKNGDNWMFDKGFRGPLPPGAIGAIGVKKTEPTCSR
jgi:hypothetical protein